MESKWDGNASKDIERLESDKNPVIKGLKMQLQECNATIASLCDEVVCNTTRAKELSTKILKVTSEAKRQELYCCNKA